MTAPLTVAFATCALATRQVENVPLTGYESLVGVVILSNGYRCGDEAGLLIKALDYSSTVGMYVYVSSLAAVASVKLSN